MYLKEKFKNLVFKGLSIIPFFEKPFPKQPFGNKPWASKEKYLELYENTLSLDDKDLKIFEQNLGYFIDLDWLRKLALKTQVVVKKEELNYFHGRVLYTVLSKYIKERKDNNIYDNLMILETGTGRGYSSICMSKAINDGKVSGQIITIDCLPHEEKIYWNSITDADGKITRKQLLSNWSNELKNILFLQGWTKKSLLKIGCERINFAFLDAQHTKEDVLFEFNFVANRQKKGDIIIFDDVSPGIFDGVCEAIKEIKNKNTYDVKEISFSPNRGYAIAYKR